MPCLRPVSGHLTSIRPRTRVCHAHTVTRLQSTSSVSATEVSHFSALASSWWDPHGPSRLLHLMNPLRHDFINSCHASFSQYPSSKRFKYLDVGCGGGIFTESAARLPTTESVIGLDPSPSVLAIAKAHARRDPLLSQSSRLTYLDKPIEGLSIPKTEDEQVDVLTLFEVLEHVNAPSRFLRTVFLLSNQVDGLLVPQSHEHGQAGS